MATRRGIIVGGMLALMVARVGTGWGAVAVATKPSATAPAKVSFDSYVKGEVKRILDALEADGKFDVAQTKLKALSDEVALLGTDKTLDAFRESAFALRMVNQLAAVPGGERLGMVKYLRANDALARALAFLIDDDKQAAGAYGVLNQLRVKHADTLNTYATLAAAICVVHDRSFVRRINENKTESPGAVALYEYYTTNEKGMLFGIRNVPAELLVYVVDTTSTIPEMEWALRKYAGDGTIGRHFFDVQYDYANFKEGTQKRVDAAGYTLPNILKYGGVCADQAFFAMEIGKAIGVPTTYTTASSAEVGHAWVGFLQSGPDRLMWNFDVGRYEEYRGIRGNVEDPQTREAIPDSYVSLLAELMGTKAHRVLAADRQASIALADAAERLSGAAVAKEALALPAGEETKFRDGLHQARKVTIEASLEMLQWALNENVANRPAWFLVGELAAEGNLTTAEKALWSNVLLQKCGEKYPDFALTIVAPMVGTVEDAGQQNGLWNAVFNKFQGRADLAAEVRMYQARLWEQQKQPARAMACYLDIINRYSNSGPFVISALAGADQLLGSDAGKEVMLYQQTWGKIQKPEDMAGPFMEQSNWYRVGVMYSEKLKAAGKVQMAEGVMGELGASERAVKK